MPNNCYFNMAIKGKPKDIKEFLKLFIYENGVENDKFFARTFLEDWDNSKALIEEMKEDINKGECEIYGWCAWSCHSCLIEGYPTEKKECITLIDACKKYNVEVNIGSEESGVGFSEKIYCNSEGDLSNECFDFVDWTCGICGETQSFHYECTKEGLKYEKCWSCEDMDKLERLFKEKNNKGKDRWYKNE